MVHKQYLILFLFLGPVEHFQKGDKFCQLSVIIMVIFYVMSAHALWSSPLSARMEGPSFTNLSEKFLANSGNFGYLVDRYEWEDTSR